VFVVKYGWNCHNSCHDIFLSLENFTMPQYLFLYTQLYVFVLMPGAANRQNSFIDEPCHLVG